MGCVCDCISGIAKCILFLFNLIILICAVLFIVVGALGLNNTFEYDVKGISIFAIILGCVIAAIAFFGCWGAANNSRCLLTLYGSIMIVIFILQVALAIVAFVAIKNGNNEFDNQVKTYLTNMYDDYKSNNASLVIINAIQKEYECCGINGPSDSQVVTSGSYILPTCCASESSTCTASEAYSQGCLSKVQEVLKVLYKAAGGIAIGFGVIELVAALFAFYSRPKH